jgi:hypothetical protein
MSTEHDAVTRAPASSAAADAVTPGDAVRSRGWTWRWTGWASWPISPAVLWVCAVAVVVDVGTSWWGQPQWYLGRVSMSPALPLGVLLVALVGPGHVGFSRRSFVAWRELLILGVPVLLVWCT